MDDSRVYILLAAYNGQKYVRQMIDSVLMQDYKNILLILSDDGSTDETPRIFDEYAHSNPDRVLHYKSGTRFGCAQNHFLHLLSTFSDAPYLMFCDQDDVWDRDKVRKTMKKMLELEEGLAVPAMVHTDMRVVDENLQVINPSFWGYSHLDGGRLALNQLLVQNVVTGCTIMINRRLAKKICGCEMNHVLMHDWWIALVASVCGKVGYLSEQTMNYRQHGENVVGAKNVRSVGFLWRRLTTSSMRNSLNENAKQAESLLKHYRDDMDEEQRTLINAFIHAQRSSIWIRDYYYVKYGLLKFGAVRIAAQLLGL